MISATSLLIIESAMELYIKRKEHNRKELQIFEKKLQELEGDKQDILRCKAVTKIESIDSIIVQCRDALREVRASLVAVEDKN